MRQVWNDMRNWILGFRLREQMLMLYLVGGIVPLLLANIYMYHSVRSVLIEQTKSSNLEQVQVLADSLSESMSVVETVSKNLYFNDEIEHIATNHYEDYEEILADYRNASVLSDYQSNYYQEISSITIYTYNTTLSDNENFVYAGAKVKSARWFINAVDNKGAPYWYYEYDDLKQKENLSMARALYTDDFELIGVMNISLQNKRSELLISQQSNIAMLVYKDTAVLHTNQDDMDNDELLSLLSNHEEESFSDIVTYQGKRYMLSYEKVYPEYSDQYYTVVMMEPYSEIAWVATKTSMQNMVPLLLCIIVALFLLIRFSRAFANRITSFRDEMHKAATGDFRIAEKIPGQDEIAELYQDLNDMIQDIQELMDRVVQEQVSKEQIRSRQKEVEFKMLASQINPHFLYNTLETIRMQALVNGQKDIGELAKMLAKIMRHNIQVKDTIQPVSEELKLVEYYMKIQDYRFRDRISYEIKVDSDAIRNLKMMPLLIQPYVENAYVHGLEKRERDGLISIVVEVRNHLWVTIKDNGTGMTEEELGQVRYYLNDFDNLDRTHIGIANVNQRIKLQYGEDYGVTIESLPNSGTEVTIKLPLIYE